MFDNYYEDAVSLLKNGMRVFVPGIGLIEGGIEAVTTGSATGAAKFLVPGIGIVEGAFEGSADAARLAGLSGGVDALKNAALSVTTLALLAGGALLILVVLKK